MGDHLCVVAPKQLLTRHCCLGIALSAVLLVATTACNKTTGGPTTPSAPTPHANVTLSSVSGTGDALPSGGYTYSVSVMVREGGGVAATLTQWDIALQRDTAGFGAVHFDAGSLGEPGSSISANSTKVLVFTFTDARPQTPYATDLTVTVTYGGGAAGSNTASASGRVAPLPAPTIGVPSLSSPISGQEISTTRPTLTTRNASISGLTSAVTYRFEISEQSTFPVGSRTDFADGIQPGADGTTSWQVPHSLIVGFVYYWRVRASSGTLIGVWSTVETFRTPQATPPPAPPTTPSPAPAPSPTPNPGPTPQPVTMNWSIKNTCNVTQNLKFYDEDNKLVWPSASSHYTLSPGATETYNLSCQPNANVCVGGNTNADGSGAGWGVGLSNNQSCTNCCYRCVSGTVTPEQVTCTTITR